jgi:metaxin
VHLARRLYVEPSSASRLVRKFLSRQLYGAAEAELLKYPARVDSELLYEEAKRALEALSILLGSNEWFFEEASPGLFDASVFAYTHLLLDIEMGWREDRLTKSVLRWKNLVRHRERILSRYPTSRIPRSP